MRESIDIARREDEASAELKGILAELVLMMSGRPRAIAALEVVTASQVQQIGGAQIGYRISPALFIDEQRKRDARFFPENSCIVPVAQPDSS